MKLLNDKRLYFVPANKNKGFNFGYFICLKFTNPAKTLQLIGECNNTGVNDDVNEEIKNCEHEIKFNNFVAKQLQQKLENSAIIFPTFLRPPISKTNNLNTHFLSSMSISTSYENLQRVDKQFLNMISNAKKQLAKLGFRSSEKIIMTGFSSSAKFAQRFAFLYPNTVKSVIAGGTGALISLPLPNYKAETLNFPLGTNNYKKLTGRNFNLKAFLKVPHYWFMGDKDTNDPVSFDDCFSDEERKIIYNIFGKDMQKERWKNMNKVIQEQKLTNYHTYLLKDIDHKPHKIFETLEKDNFNYLTQKIE